MLHVYNLLLETSFLQIVWKVRPEVSRSLCPKQAFTVSCCKVRTITLIVTYSDDLSILSSTSAFFRRLKDVGGVGAWRGRCQRLLHSKLDIANPLSLLPPRGEGRSSLRGRGDLYTYISVR